jgi:hypothetical protein
LLEAQLPRVLAATPWSALEKDRGVRGLSPRCEEFEAPCPWETQDFEAPFPFTALNLSLHNSLSNHIHDEERVQEMKRSGHEEMSGQL